MSEEHLYASVSGEALIAGRSPFPSLGPRVGVRIAPSGRGVDAAGEPRADLAASTRVAYALTPPPAMSEVPFPVARDHPVGTARGASIDQSHADNGWRSPAGGCIHHLEGKVMPCSISIFLGPGVHPRVGRLVADRDPGRGENCP